MFPRGGTITSPGPEFVGMAIGDFSAQPDLGKAATDRKQQWEIVSATSLK